MIGKAYHFLFVNCFLTIFNVDDLSLPRFFCIFVGSIIKTNFKMKRFITLLFALAVVALANAQREYRSYYDDVYLSIPVDNFVDGYDEVETVYDRTTKKLVVHNELKEVIHVKGKTEEIHYNEVGVPIGSVRLQAPRHRLTNQIAMRRNVQRYGHINSYRSDGYTCLGDADDSRWLFFFQLNSDYLTNKEELGHLIDYANRNPYATFNIDAYADAETGGYDVNMNISRARADAVIRVLRREGIGANRLYVQYHGSVIQPYRTNNLNRCVRVSIRYRR